MAIPAKNILGNPNVTEGSFQIAIEQLRESVIGSGKVYDSANTYMAKDTCEYSGVMYYSKINNNIGNTPSIGANWGDYADLILGVVHKTGDETIPGVKTFSSSPIVPTPTANTQAANKAYADLKVALTAFTGTNVNLAENGYQKLPSGLIIQWGAVSGSTGTLIGTFPITFPNAVLGRSVTLADKGGGNLMVILYNSNSLQTNSQIGALLQGYDSDGWIFNYIAIGY